MGESTVCVVTGARAEYGLLYWLMREISTAPDLRLQLVVTGMHLSPDFGLTYQQIEDDGFHIDAKVDMLLSSDSPVGVAKSLGLGVIGFADTFARLRPDVVVLLGDRFEVFAAAQAAMLARIPIAHIHGGETTEGAVDEAIRHSLTKMASVHFVAAEPYRQRVIQLGENPDRVFNVGAPGLDHIRRTPLLNRSEFEQAIDFRLVKVNFLVTYHPVTLAEEDPQKTTAALFAALDWFPDAHIIITKPNADAGGRIIADMIDAYARERQGRVLVAASLGQVRYLSAIRHVDAVIGNSSSGLIEVPAFQKPTVNIGQRQAGRLRAKSVIDCADDESSIATAIDRALSAEFRNSLNDVVSPYGSGNASLQMTQYLRTIRWDDVLVKRFHDLPCADRAQSDTI